MTQYERMIQGLVYDPGDPEIMKEQVPLQGGHHVHLGEYVYINSNMTMVDDGNIFIGSRVMFGPNVMIATANHPVNPELRRKGLQYNKDVCIGANAVIGAGSVVRKDIPDNVVAVGNPCRVLRKVGERDRQFFYKEERIDRENLQ